jgi:hypothetical protein
MRIRWNPEDAKDETVGSEARTVDEKRLTMKVGWRSVFVPEQ